jgi:predicted ATPase/DNA-binding CsgD family transcriptional regulator
VSLARSPHNASLGRDLEGGRVVDLPAAPRRPYGNLPSELTSFIGRERETAEMKRSLGDVRLLTLTGPGGCGKTRLALALGEDLAERFEGGVWWVELAPVSDPALVPRAVASALGVHEQVGRSLGDLLRDHLESRRLLLILDNCEHLVEACATLANTLLRACPDLRILATSREAMGIAGENVVLVPALSLPDPQAALEGLPRGDAVRLFVDRATTVAPDFALDEQNAPALARICQRLDGLPLAIELAAAKVKVLSVEQISTRLDDCFRLLGPNSRTSLPHQRTLRATMDWSHDLLGRKEQILFRRLSVFSGGFTLEAAEEICAGGDIGEREVLAWLSRLVDKSLVLAGEQGGEARYHLLETVREYGQERLQDSGEAARIRRRHGAFFLDLAERAESGLTGARQGWWLACLEAEFDNLRAAIGWSLGEEPEAGLRLAGALWEFCYMRGHYGEGREWLEGALARSGGSSPAFYAKALAGAGILDLLQCEYDRATALLEESLAIYKELEDGWGIGSALQSLGSIARERGRYAEAEALHNESLALQRELGNEEGIARSLDGLGFAAWLQGDPDLAWSLCSEALNLYRGLQDTEGIAWSLVNLGAAAQYRGDVGRATALLEESLMLSREAGYKEGIAWSLNQLGIVAQRQGDHEQATTFLRESFELHVDLGDRWRAASVLEGLAVSARRQRLLEPAARLLGAAKALREQISTPVPPCERAVHDDNVSALSTVMGEEAFAAALAQGRTLKAAQILAESSPVAVPATSTAGLTAREVEVLRLVAGGLNDPQVAEQLFISRRTVHAHLRSIYQKLGVTTRTAATRFALENSLL